MTRFHAFNASIITLAIAGASCTKAPSPGAPLSQRIKYDKQSLSPIAHLNSNSITAITSDDVAFLKAQGLLSSPEDQRLLEIIQK